MNKFFEKREIIEFSKEISVELETELTEKLKEICKKHNIKFRFVVDFEVNEWC